MNADEKVVKHLEMAQDVVNRLAGNSFSIKSWSMAIIGAALIFIARADVANPDVLFALLLPVIGFWYLDSYYLWQERLFRAVYDDVRAQSDTDFSMNPMKHASKPNCSRAAVFFSQTLVAFYMIEAFTIGVVILIVKCF